MDMLTHCRAMAAFCRQRAEFEGENGLFWLTEAAEWNKLIAEHADLSRSEPQERPETKSIGGRGY